MNSKNTTVIAGDDEDVTFLLIATFRYSLYRKTYVSDWASRLIQNNMDVLARSDITLLLEELQERLQVKDDLDWDLPSWQSLKIALTKELERRVDTGDEPWLKQKQD